MAALSFDSMAGIDIGILILLIVVYLVLIFVPMIISLWLAQHRPNDKRSEKEFDQTWYKWKKQYMWHELWFRSHLILLLALIVIFIYESAEWPLWAPFSIVPFFVLTAVALKYVSKRIEQRVPSDDMKKKLYEQTMRSSTDTKELIAELQDEVEAAGKHDAKTVGSFSVASNGTSGHGELVDKVEQEIELQTKKGGNSTTDQHHE